MTKQLPHDHGQAMEHELDHMPNAGEFQTAAEIFKQLGDTSRLRIFWLLCHCEECVINISSMVEMSSPAVSPADDTINRMNKREVYCDDETTAPRSRPGHGA